VSGLPLVVKKLGIPVYLTHLAAPTLDWQGVPARVECFQAGHSLAIGDLKLNTFTIPPDAIDPIGFVVEAHGQRAGIVTDLGYIPDSIRVHLRGVDFLLLESNHDIEMLKVGPYPWSVKQRVMGRNGHLSNDVVSQFILEDLDATVRTLVLGHLSEHNNHPELARMVAAQAIERRGLATELVVSAPRVQSGVFETQASSSLAI
jgi:phosphoribosyl 1,2-cyclic phosphodiesterase